MLPQSVASINIHFRSKPRIGSLHILYCYLHYMYLNFTFLNNEKLSFYSINILYLWIYVMKNSYQKVMHYHQFILMKAVKGTLFFKSICFYGPLVHAILFTWNRVNIIFILQFFQDHVKVCFFLTFVLKWSSLDWANTILKWKFNS